MALPPASSMLSSRQGGTTSAVNIDSLERAGRRTTLLQRYAPEFVNSSPEGALTLAESAVSDDAMLQSASGAVGFANIQQLRTDLEAENDTAAHALWLSLPEAIQKALGSLGYQPPEPPKRGAGRWGINLPDLLPGPNELTISRDTPILGPLGKGQAVLGEVLEGVRDVVKVPLDPVLQGFEWLGDQSLHFYRATQQAQAEGAYKPWKPLGLLSAGGVTGPLGAVLGGLTPSELAKAWRDTDEEDAYVRPGHRQRARRYLGGDEQSYRLARYVMQGFKPDQIIEAEGLEPGSQEATALVMTLQGISGTPEFGKAVHELSTGQISFGRVVSNSLGLDDTDAGWGRFVSGTLDAGFDLASDPTNVAGPSTKALRFGRAAFTLETSADVARGYRTTDLALMALRDRLGSKVGKLTTELGRVRPWEMHRGRAVLNWADRVAEGFQTNQFGKLMRDIPSVATAISAMQDYHVRRVTEGLTGLDDTLGVVEWLQGRDGILAMAGSRVGGVSPMVQGLRVPSLNIRDRLLLQTKDYWQRGLDWSRVQYAPHFKELLGELGNPSGLGRELGRWTLGHTVGDTGRVLTALTSHLPYNDVLPLYGPEAVPEFSRLVNTGIFSGLDRVAMDDYVNAFTVGDFVTRSNMVEQFLKELFERSGVADTDFANRFVGRLRQAYSVDGIGDSLSVDGLISRGARLVDAQHADALAIPKPAAFLAASTKANMLRVLFHNPGASWVDATLGKAWKPSVLMRLGFIPRAAGEEALHFILKHGPRTYLGAKGAEWQIQEQIGHELRARLAEARSLGQVDEVNRLHSALAETTGALAPVRALMAGSDRMFTRFLESNKSSVSPWRQRLVQKAHDLDDKGVVSGLENFANRMSLSASGVFREVANATHMPTKAEIGGWMAKHWDPWAAVAARDMLDNPWVARAFAEQVSGATMMPYEFRAATTAGGVPVRKVRLGELRGGHPVVEEVELRPEPGAYKTLDRTVDQDQGFYESIYARHNWLTSDRVGNAVVSNVLPRWVGPWGKPLSKRLGYRHDLVALRQDLNNAWAHPDGQKMLGVLRQYVDGEEIEAGVGWMGGRLKALFNETGSGLSAGKLISIIDDPKVPMAAKRWLLYPEVDPSRLVDDFKALTRQMHHAARGRLSRPDMYRHLRENRLYASGEPALATPIAHGISKVYVPLMPAQNQALGLGEDFVEVATKRITRIGGYSPEVARGLAERVRAAALTEGSPGMEQMATKPLATWGASDPRVAEAVMASVEEVTGVRPMFGILEVPDGIIQRSAGANPQGLVANSASWELADDYVIEPYRLLHTKPTAQTRRLNKLEVGEGWYDEVEFDAAAQALRHSPPTGYVRLWRGQANYATSGEPASATTAILRLSDDQVAEYAAEAGLEIGAARAELERMVSEVRSSTAGRWWTDDPRIAASFAQATDPGSIGDLHFVDLPAAEVAPYRADRLSTGHFYAAGGGGFAEFEWVLPGDMIGGARTHRLPVSVADEIDRTTGTVPADWEQPLVTGRQVSEGLGELEALERVADGSVDEILETLTTNRREDLDSDVLHEIVEPLLRGDKVYLDEAGNKVIEPGYNWNHLVAGTSPERLPILSYGPDMILARDIKWSKFVQEWFQGPVNQAISSVIRKPMFLHNYGQQLRNVRGVAELFVDPEIAGAAKAAGKHLGFDDEALDTLALNSKHATSDEALTDLIRTMVDDADLEIDPTDLSALRDFARQRNWGLDVARENALNRAMQLTIPFIDDHRIRSAFQSYVGNFIPFLFAEEQFLKRWVRSSVESPEMVRKAQLAMNGLRAMGTVRRDDQGRDIFVYPLVGEAAQVMANVAPDVFGVDMSLPYPVQMTGDVGYALPGFGDQMGVPSVGPLVGLGIEYLSRHYPELADVEQVLVSRGADRPLWQYIVPTGAGKLWEAAFADMDAPQLASLNAQAIQMMALNGQLPSEDATPAEREEFLERVRGQTRFLAFIRAGFGLNAPAAPQIQFKAEELVDEFNQLLQADIPMEEAVQIFLGSHPDADPTSLLAATVSRSESVFSGLDMPTDKAFDWVEGNADLVAAFPAASAWLIPRADATDAFSYRAWNQQVAKGLRSRKAPQELLDDIYFAMAARDYFDVREQHEERMLTATGGARRRFQSEWDTWKKAYFNQHPTFANSLQDPTRQQRRRQALDELTVLSADPAGHVPDEMRELLQRYDEYRLNTAGLRGDRRAAVTRHRRELTQEFVAWAAWHIRANPHLAALYLRTIEPELVETDEDAVTGEV